MKSVRIHTDGGCIGNPGPGAWAAVLQYGHHRRELSGGELATTNNRMELTAAIQALSSLREPCSVEFFTDSTYVRNGITQWIRGWRARGWVTQQKQPVKNEDLWRALDTASAPHQIAWKWLRGHSGHPENERCDALASSTMEELVARHSAAHLHACLLEFQKSQSPRDPLLF